MTELVIPKPLHSFEYIYLSADMQDKNALQVKGVILSSFSNIMISLLIISFLAYTVLPEPYVPYTIEISAATHAGEGDMNTIIEFTKEGGKSQPKAFYSFLSEDEFSDLRAGSTPRMVCMYIYLNPLHIDTV